MTHKQRLQELLDSIPENAVIILSHMSELTSYTTRSNSFRGVANTGKFKLVIEYSDAYDIITSYPKIKGISK